MPAAGQTAFAAAVAATEVALVALEAEAVAAARADVVVVGELHGVRETCDVVYSLIVAGGARTLALEWAREEMERVVDDLDVARLWELPPDAEVFHGDGRITASHFALLRRLRDENRLDHVVLLDVVGSEGADRQRVIAERLASAPRSVVAVVGGAHVRAIAPPDAALVGIEYPAGSCFFHGDRAIDARRSDLPVVVRAPATTAAVVPSAT